MSRSAPANRVDHAPLDAARSSRDDVDLEHDADGVVGGAGREADLRRGEAAALQERIEAGAVERHLATDELAVRGELGLPEEIVDVDGGAVRVDVDALDDPPRHHADGDANAVGSAGGGGVRIGERPRREHLVQGATDRGHREPIADVELGDVGLALGPAFVVDDDLDAGHPVADEGSDLAGDGDLGDGGRQRRNRRVGVDRDLVAHAADCHGTRTSGGDAPGVRRRGRRARLRGRERRHQRRGQRQDEREREAEAREGAPRRRGDVAGAARPHLRRRMIVQPCARGA